MGILRQEDLRGEEEAFDFFMVMALVPFCWLFLLAEGSVWLLFPSLDLVQPALQIGRWAFMTFSNWALAASSAAISSLRSVLVATHSLTSSSRVEILSILLFLHLAAASLFLCRLRIFFLSTSGGKEDTLSRKFLTFVLDVGLLLLCCCGGGTIMALLFNGNSIGGSILILVPVLLKSDGWSCNGC